VLNEKTVREHRKSVADAIALIEKSRQPLIAMLKADDEWLAINAPSNGKQHGDVGKAGVHRNDLTHEEAALIVLGDHLGSMLTTKELWPRMKIAGATSDAKDPISSVDYTLHHMMKKGLTEKVGPRTYRLTSKGQDALNQLKRDRLFPLESSLFVK
jgi:hypothetical protein